jgi:hypothetical protein
MLRPPVHRLSFGPFAQLGMIACSIYHGRLPRCLVESTLREANSLLDKAKVNKNGAKGG